MVKLSVVQNVVVLNSQLPDCTQLCLVKHHQPSELASSPVHRHNSQARRSTARATLAATLMYRVYWIQRQEMMKWWKNHQSCAFIILSLCRFRAHQLSSLRSPAWQLAFVANILVVIYCLYTAMFTFVLSLLCVYTSRQVWTTNGLSLYCLFIWPYDVISKTIQRTRFDWLRTDVIDHCIFGWSKKCDSHRMNWLACVHNLMQRMWLLTFGWLGPWTRCFSLPQTLLHSYGANHNRLL